MTPEEAAAAIRRTALAFGERETTIHEFWGSFHEHLYSLCGDHPLDGDWLAAFDALEAWEVATGPEREVAVESARAVARRLGDVP